MFDPDFFKNQKTAAKMTIYRTITTPELEIISAAWTLPLSSILISSSLINLEGWSLTWRLSASKYGKDIKTVLKVTVEVAAEIAVEVVADEVVAVEGMKAVERMAADEGMAESIWALFKKD